MTREAAGQSPPQHDTETFPRPLRSLHALADQLRQMSDQTEEPGVASDVTRQVSERTRSVAQWLEHREPGELSEDIRPPPRTTRSTSPTCLSAT
jgi:hypothetical protein